MEQKVKDKLQSVLNTMEESTDFTVLSEMKAALNSVYGEERNQIVKPSVDGVIARARELDIEDYLIAAITSPDTSVLPGLLRESLHQSACYSIIIYFPEITIANGKMEHLIKDIYVKVFVRNNGTIEPYIQGLRTTVTKAEFVSQYLHSHLPGLDPMYISFEDFCTGSGEINQVLAVLSNRYSAANFMMLLMHIKNFLEWESKEGNPYKFMENIANYGNRFDHYSILSREVADNIADRLIKKAQSYSADAIMKMFIFSVSERFIKADATLEAEKWMAEMITELGHIEVRGRHYATNKFLCLKDSDGRYFVLPQESMPDLSHAEDTILIFKGKEIKFQITDRTETVINETFANPKITKEFCKKFSSLLSRTALTTAGIKSGSSLVHIS